MGLGQNGKAVALEPLHQPQLPQRLLAVELLGEDPTTQRLELGLGPRARQRGVADMELGLEVRIVDPPGAPLVEGHEGEPLAVARDEMQPPRELLHELVVGRSCALEDHAGRHVHVGGVVLQVQEGGIEAAEAIRGSHAPILRRGAAKRKGTSALPGRQDSPGAPCVAHRTHPAGSGA